MNVNSRDEERLTRAILIFILCGAALFRFASCAEYVYVDEPAVFGNIVKYFRDRTLMPSHVLYPNLFEYLSAIPTGMGAIALSAMGTIPSSIDIYALFSLHSVLAVLPSRFTSSIFALLTIVLLFKIGQRFFDRKTALLAVAFLSFSKLHISYSCLALPDVTMTFFSTCSLLFSLSALRTKAVQDFILAGVFAGFAATTKYNGAFIILAVLSVHVIDLYDQNRLRVLAAWFDRRIILSALAFSAAFLIGSPGWLLHPAVFFKAFVYDIEFTNTGHLGYFGMPYIHHMVLFWQWEKTTAIFFGLGLFYAIWRRSKVDIVLLTLIGLSFLHFGNLQVKKLHYLLFLYPALALIAGKMLSDFWAKFHTRLPKLGFFVIVFLGFTWPIFASAKYAYQRLVLKDSRWLAHTWIQDNIPEGSKIIVDWFYLPKLLTEEIKTEWLNGDHGQFYRARLKNIKTYQRISLIPSNVWLTEVQADYLITSSYCFERFFTTPAPPPDNPLSSQYKSRKDIYTVLLHNEKETGWELFKEIYTGKGPCILIYKKAPVFEKLNDSN